MWTYCGILASHVVHFYWSTQKSIATTQGLTLRLITDHLHSGRSSSRGIEEVEIGQYVIEIDVTVLPSCFAHILTQRWSPRFGPFQGFESWLQAASSVRNTLCPPAAGQTQEQDTAQVVGMVPLPCQRVCQTILKAGGGTAPIHKT